MPVEIRVDFRESALIAQLQQSNNDLNVIEDNLELGDIHVVYDDIRLIFERKTMSDLAASLKDGRYKEQKHRMLSHHNPRQITYIIEGARPVTIEDKFGLAKTVYDGVYIYTMYRDGIHVIHVRDVAETAAWIINVATKLSQNPAKFVEEGGAVKEYVSSCKAKSRRIDNMTPDNCYLMQLCQIPGISVKIAKTIKETYPTLRGLIENIGNARDPCELLAKLPLIGTKKAKIIVSYLLA
jgi:ERCC4-type nuclease